jgi:hypothetical protein
MINIVNNAYYKRHNKFFSNIIIASLIKLPLSLNINSIILIIIVIYLNYC